MSTVVISLIVVGVTIFLLVRMVRGEVTQPAMGDQVRDHAHRVGRGLRTAGAVSARTAAKTARSGGAVTVRAARATTATVGTGRRAFVPYEPMGEVLDGPELPWFVRIRSGLGLAVLLTLLGLALALVIGLLAISLASALESAVS